MYNELCDLILLLRLLLIIVLLLLLLSVLSLLLLLVLLLLLLLPLLLFPLPLLLPLSRYHSVIINSFAFLEEGSCLADRVSIILDRSFTHSFLSYSVLQQNVYT